MITNTTSRSEEYLFASKGTLTSRQIDLCKECRELMSHRSWDKIAERAQDVLMLRLGVSDGKTG